MSSPLVITGLGMVSPVGAGVEGSCAAIRAGINRFRELETFAARGPGEEGEWPRVVGSPVLSERGSNWALRLLLPALQGLIRTARLDRAMLSRLRLYVSLPDASLSQAHATLHQEFLPRLSSSAGVRLGPECKPGAGGHTGMLDSLASALVGVHRREWEPCIIAGVDSLLVSESLAAMDRARRLKSPRNRDGFIPGECATAILLERRKDAEKRGVQALASIESTATAREPRPVGSGEPSTGAALTDVIRRVLPHGVPAGGAWPVCDLNGESYRAREWGLVRARLTPQYNGLQRLWHPADCLGDVGASTGGVLVCVAVRAFLRNYAPAERALVWASSDDGQRTAITLAKA